jgi:membrane protease subunit HflK
VVRLNAQSMLTKDENIVDVDISVQYNILDTKAYLFNVLNPDDTVRQVAESAIRETIGQNKMDVVITGGRSAIAAKTQEEIQEILDEYQTGIHIQTVNLQSAQPPEAVQAAFSDANKAREDKQRYINQAEAYRNEIIPLAKGQAKQELERAKGYKERVVKQAEGETQRFAKVLEQYTLAPEVTRERLYIEAVQEVLTNSSKVLIDSSGNNNLMYLPLDKMIGNRSGSVTQNTPNAFDSGISSQSFRPKIESQRSRLREIR